MRNSKLAALSLFLTISTAANGIAQTLANRDANQVAPTASQSATAGSSEIEALTRSAIEVPYVTGVRVSPDGKQVIYTVARASVADNRHTTELLVRPIEGVGSETPVVIERKTGPEVTSFSGVVWCPDSQGVSYLSPTSGDLMKYDLSTGKSAPVLVNDQDSGDRPRITKIGAGYKWSPSGNLIAFVAAIDKGGRLTPTAGVRVEEGSPLINNMSFNIPQKGGLFVLDTGSGRLEQITLNNLNVSGFDWSPDGRELVISAIEDGRNENRGRSERRDLFVVGLAAKSVRSLVTQLGNESSPLWSPDGKWIAFSRTVLDWNKAHNNSVVTTVAAVPAAGGSVVSFVSDDPFYLDPLGPEKAWTPDSRAFYYRTVYHMTSRLQRADVTTGRVSALPVVEGEWADDFSFGPDRKWVAFVRSSPITPPELCIRNLSDGAVKQLTNLSPIFPLASRVQSEIIQWPSADGRFMIQSLLLTPKGSIKNGKATTPLPTLLRIWGGPSMVHAEYDRINPAVLALVASGYAVLIPTARGRGGYGDAFRRAFEVEKSFAQKPHEDVMAGIDYLIKKGVADSNRLGVFGQSYGGYYTMYAVTQTDRFRAAVNYEGLSAVWVVDDNMRVIHGSVAELVFPTARGAGNPFEPKEMQRLIGETPAFNMHKVKTPTLHMYGEKSRILEFSGVVYYSAIRKLGIPGELVVYDEGHQFWGPLNQVDYISRIGAWFDYWVRDMPYPEPELQKKYDPWKTKHAAKYVSRKPTSAAATAQEIRK